MPLVPLALCVAVVPKLLAQKAFPPQLTCAWEHIKDHTSPLASRDLHVILTPAGINFQSRSMSDRGREGPSTSHARAACSCTLTSGHAPCSCGAQACRMRQRRRKSTCPCHARAPSTGMLTRGRWSVQRTCLSRASKQRCPTQPTHRDTGAVQLGPSHLHFRQLCHILSCVLGQVDIIGWAFLQPVLCIAVTSAHCTCPSHTVSEPPLYQCVLVTLPPPLHCNISLS